MARVKIDVELPPIDGMAEVGIAVGTDKGLPEERKLRVLSSGSREERIMYAAASASLIRDVEHSQMVIAAGVAAEKFKLFKQKKESTDPDCDVIIDSEPKADVLAKANEPGFQAVGKDILVNKVDEDAFAVIIATKVTFWQSNHHTGGGKLAHYAKKVYDIKFRGTNVQDQISSDAATSDVHMIGHWASTCYL